MKTQRVRVVDGPVPAEFREGNDMEPDRKSGMGQGVLCALALCALLSVAGCAGNKATETRPTPVSSPTTITNPPDE